MSGLLPNERDAALFVDSIGIERATSILNKIYRRFDRRYKRACDNSFVMISVGSIYQTKLEKDLAYKIKLGLMLAPKESSSSIKERILNRRAFRMANRNVKESP